MSSPLSLRSLGSSLLLGLACCAAPVTGHASEADTPMPPVAVPEAHDITTLRAQVDEAYEEVARLEAVVGQDAEKPKQVAEGIKHQVAMFDKGSTHKSVAAAKDQLPAARARYEALQEQLRAAEEAGREEQEDEVPAADPEEAETAQAAASKSVAALVASTDEEDAACSGEGTWDKWSLVPLAAIIATLVLGLQYQPEGMEEAVPSLIPAVS